MGIELNIRKFKLGSLYLSILILAISESIISFLQSSYLNQYFSIKFLSFIFIVSYIFTFWAIIKYPKLIKKFNNYQTALLALIIKIFSLAIIVFTAYPPLIFFAYILLTLSFNLVFINFDIFLNALTPNKATGRIRGIYYGLYNLGWLIAPLISGNLADKFGFVIVYWVDLILTIILLGVLFLGFKNLAIVQESEKNDMLKTFRRIYGDFKINKIFFVAFIVQCYYTIMYFYTPIYLNQTIGFDWSEIGFILVITLLPFIIFQYPAGYLADKHHMERAILIFGLILLSIGSLLIFSYNFKNMLGWILILLFVNVGASLIDIMKETLFFKKVKVNEFNLINAFRSITPLAHILTPAIIFLILIILPYQYIFLLLGIFAVLGFYPAYKISN